MTDILIINDVQYAILSIIDKYMNIHKLPVFDVWFDGNMSIAQNITNAYDVHSNEAIENFYDEYLTKYDEYLPNMDVDMFPKLHILRNVLYDMASERILRMPHFLCAYAYIFYEWDVLRGYNVSPFMEQMSIPILSEDVDTIKNDILSFGAKYSNVAPFASLRGTFGINTFLYLFFNRIAPIACSLNPYRAHSDVPEGIIPMMAHDFAHLYIYNHIFQNNIYFEKLKKVYLMIFSDACSLGIDRMKAFLFILFRHIHELPRTIDCSREAVPLVSDELPMLLHIGYYTPSRYGFDEELVKSYILDDNRNGLIAAYDYADLAIREMFGDFCTQYGKYL